MTRSAARNFVLLGCWIVGGTALVHAQTFNSLPLGGRPATTSTATVAPAATGGATPSGLQISKGTGTLPNQHGQVWREYDLTPYTSRVKDVPKPEQAIIDWVLRETGIETWFGTPLGVLSADRNTLRVYHTPDVQNAVRGIVERFVGVNPDAHSLHLRIMTVSNPAWRSTSAALLKSVDVQSSGVDAWLLTRENAAVLVDQLKKRADYKELAELEQPVLHGQPLPLSQVHPKNFIRWLKVRPDGWSGADPVPGVIDEGFTLKLSPLMSLDGRTVEAQVDCTIDQVEKLVSVPLDIQLGGRLQRSQIQVPQLVSWRLAERFRWPADHVLLLSCGVVASPTGDPGGALSFIKPLEVRGSRSDALMLIDFTRRSSITDLQQRPATPAGTLSTNPVSRGRY